MARKSLKISDSVIVKQIKSGLSIPKAAVTNGVGTKETALAFYRLEPVADPSLKIEGTKAQVANAIVAVPTYLFRTLWPARLAAFYPFEPALPGWQIAGAAALIALVTGAAIVLRRSFSCLATGWGWFLVSLVPVIGAPS